MARPQEYDRTKVLKSAMEVFRQQGYGATSVPNLVTATGLQPGSIYAAFGSKKGLLLEALQAYSDENIAQIDQVLRAETTAMGGLYTFLKQTSSSCNSKSGRYGCLMLNTLLEMSAQDEETDALLQQLIGRIERRLVEQLELAQFQGELANDQDPSALAKFVLTNVWGLRVLGKQNANAKDFQLVVGQVISYLKSCTAQSA